MSRLRILVAGLICGLIISLAVNVNMAWELMELYREREIYRDLSRNYDELQASCLSLLQSYRELKGILNESLPKPPISKSEATDIALEYGGWNETFLEGMEVSATLKYYCFDISGWWMTPLHQVAGHIPDFHPRTVGNATFRYLWVVVVSKKEGYSIPPPGLYYVDPITGDVTSYNDIMGGSSWLWQRLGIPGWIMAEKDPSGVVLPLPVQVTARDLLSYPKLDLALQEAEIASLKHLAHPLEMIELTNCEAKAIVEFLSGKPANATEGMTYGFIVYYNETLYSVSMIFTWIPPVKS